MDKINQLIETIEKTYEELQEEYFNLWDNDSDLQEAFQLLEDTQNYMYTIKGLCKYVEMEFDFDEYSEEAFFDYAHAHDIHVDMRASQNTSSRIYKPIANYLALVEDEPGVCSAILSLEGEEETIDVSLEFEDTDERDEYLKEFLENRNYGDIVTVAVDSWRNVELIDLNESAEHAS